MSTSDHKGLIRYRPHRPLYSYIGIGVASFEFGGYQACAAATPMNFKVVADGDAVERAKIALTTNGRMIVNDDGHEGKASQGQ